MRRMLHRKRSYITMYMYNPCTLYTVVFNWRAPTRFSLPTDTTTIIVRVNGNVKDSSHEIGCEKVAIPQTQFSTAAFSTYSQCEYSEVYYLKLWTEQRRSGIVGRYIALYAEMPHASYLYIVFIVLNRNCKFFGKHVCVAQQQNIRVSISTVLYQQKGK